MSDRVRGGEKDHWSLVIFHFSFVICGGAVRATCGFNKLAMGPNDK